ncbi:MAG: helix-turn-helix domain containing protein [Deltaproteobacteria bacterium]
MNQQTDFKSLDRSLRKQRIIDTAVTIFHEKGYRSATLDDVAKEQGLTTYSIKRDSLTNRARYQTRTAPCVPVQPRGDMVRHH